MIKVRWVTFEDSPNMNSNPLPKHAIGYSGVNNVEVGSKERVLKVTMMRLYNILVRSGHSEKSTKCHVGKIDFCLFHKKKRHHIEECIEFH